MGPICTVLLSRSVDEAMLSRIDAWLQTIVQGNIECMAFSRQFWVDSERLGIAVQSDCAFMLDIDAALQDFESSEVAQISAQLGAPLKTQLIIAAGCNQQADHVIVGQLALALVQQFGGIIDFGGDLHLAATADFHELSGKLINLSNTDDNAYHICDEAFLQSWIAHPAFRLIK